MGYDPFAPGDGMQPDGKSNKLFKARPPILSVRLSNLEWLPTSDIRKRPRLQADDPSRHDGSVATQKRHRRDQRMTDNDGVPNSHNGNANGTHDAASSAQHASFPPRSDPAQTPCPTGDTTAADTNIDVNGNSNGNVNVGSASAEDTDGKGTLREVKSYADDPDGNGKIREVQVYIEKPVIVEPTTIMGVPPLVDDRVRQLVQFILGHVKGPNVEVEAKLGVLVEKHNDLRVIELVPVLCETPIKATSNSDVRFVSDVGNTLFHKFNQTLNARVEQTSQQNEGHIRYLRTRETDVYHPGRVRVTKAHREDNSTYVVRSQRKVRLGDLNVICPGRVCDIRYSASTEESCEEPNTKVELEREKDRISYKFDCLSVDITTVTMTSRSGGIERTFEVEVEIDESANLFDEVTKYRDGNNSSKLFDIAGSMVNTLRILLEL